MRQLQLVVAKRDDNSALPASKETPSMGSGIKRALIVTTHPGALAGLSITHDICNSSADALRLAEANQYAAIFIDLAELTCRTSGSQVIRALREKEILTPTCLMTAEPTLVERSHALRRGATLIARNPEAITKTLSGVPVNLDQHTGPSTSVQSSKSPPQSRPTALSGPWKKITDLLANYTGPAAIDQAAGVFKRRGPGISLDSFMNELSAYLTDANDRELFLKQASKELTK